MLKLVTYNELYLHESLQWLNDPEIRALTDTQVEVRQDLQECWYANIQIDSTYQIWGIEYNGVPIGACGIKHISYIHTHTHTHTHGRGEYWGYIGEKNYWGGKGHLIFEQIYLKARELNIETLTLNVLKTNARAIRLYKNEGFSLISENDNILTMHKRL